MFVIYLFADSINFLVYIFSLTTQESFEKNLKPVTFSNFEIIRRVILEYTTL